MIIGFPDLRKLLSNLSRLPQVSTSAFYFRLCNLSTNLRILPSFFRSFDIRSLLFYKSSTLSTTIHHGSILRGDQGKPPFRHPRGQCYMITNSVFLFYRSVSPRSLTSPALRSTSETPIRQYRQDATFSIPFALRTELTPSNPDSGYLPLIVYLGMSGTDHSSQFSGRNDQVIDVERTGYSYSEPKPSLFK